MRWPWGSLREKVERLQAENYELRRKLRELDDHHNHLKDELKGSMHQARALKREVEFHKSRQLRDDTA